MQILKTIPIILGVSLLVSSCARKPGKYNLIGTWESDCYQPGSNKYTQKTVYSPDGSFESQSSVKFFLTYNVYFSGTYKATKNKLVETITNSSNPATIVNLPQSQTSNLKWIDDNSITVVTGNTKCMAIRLESN
ncbi:MAG: hypothetical protein QNJ55_22565 [Xenococcus sp. MO_188.B8]|nr:hypothetical protein [Xenococcus sp. MO_188.B8]